MTDVYLNVTHILKIVSLVTLYHNRRRDAASHTPIPSEESQVPGRRSKEQVERSAKKGKKFSSSGSKCEWNIVSSFVWNFAGNLLELRCDNCACNQEDIKNGCVVEPDSGIPLGFHEEQIFEKKSTPLANISHPGIDSYGWVDKI